MNACGAWASEHPTYSLVVDFGMSTPLGLEFVVVDGNRRAHGGCHVDSLHIGTFYASGLVVLDAGQNGAGVVFELFGTEADLANGQVDDAGAVNAVFDASS